MCLHKTVCVGKDDLDKLSSHVQPGYNLSCVVLLLHLNYILYTNWEY